MRTTVIVTALGPDGHGRARNERDSRGACVGHHCAGAGVDRRL